MQKSIFIKFIRMKQFPSYLDDYSSFLISILDAIFVAGSPFFLAQHSLVVVV